MMRRVMEEQGVKFIDYSLMTIIKFNNYKEM